MKKLLALVLATVMLLGMTSAMAMNNEGYDLQGNKVILRIFDNINPYDPDTTEADRANWLPRYEAVKEAYNCDFEFYTTTTEWDDMPAEWIMSVTSNDPAWHVTNNLSSMWLMRLVKNNALGDVSTGLSKIDIPQQFKDAGARGDGNYGFITSYQDTEVLVFNRKMIMDAGMEMDPAEMFMAGKWDYDSFFNYMVELQSKLPEGTYAFFIDPNYWGIFAPPANGGEMAVHTDYSLGLLSDAYLETFELLEKLIAAGVVRPVNRNEAGAADYWGTPGATFDQGIEVAMTHRATWQMWTLNNNGLDWGVVPYPWGSAVKAEIVDDELVLENYYATYYDMALSGSVLAGVGVDFPGLEEDYVNAALVSLMYDLMWDAEEQADIAAIADPDYELEMRTDVFQDMLSAEIYHFLRCNTIYNPLASLYNAEIGTSYGGTVSLSGLNRKPFDDGTSVRATFEAAVPEIEASLRDAGLIK